MTQLTEHQTEFILKRFFENEKYSGWRNIGRKLLKNGRCIVAGNDCIWKGGIGNFIKTEPSNDAVDCLEYTFNLEEFLQSEWFKEILELHIKEVYCTKKKIQLDLENKQKEYDEIFLLNKTKPKSEWNYSVSSNSIWSNFDSGTVEADTYEEALHLAKLELKYNFEKINHVLHSADITRGFVVEYSESSIEIEKQKL